MARCLLIIFAIGFQGLSADDFIHKFTGSFEGKSAFDMSLEIDTNKVRGVYFYHKHMKDIRLSGEVINKGSTLVLEEYGSDNKPAAKFTFHLKPADRKSGNFLSQDFGTDPLEGHWSFIGQEKQQKVMIDYTGSCAGELDNLYRNRRDDETHAQMKLFWEALKKGDKAKVVSSVIFPIKVNVNGKRRSVKNRQELLSIYSEVFDKDYIAKVSSHPPRNLWINYQGIMLGQGVAWFNYSGKVIAINN